MKKLLAVPLHQLHSQPVVVLTVAGVPVSIGRVLISEDTSGMAVQRVDIEFETEQMKCALGVPVHKWEALIASWDGASARYTLPTADKFWTG